ncbi:SDR family oxidoreductase [Streptomyces sp. VNUA24]|uniref:SDR family NAD(P)-dependent oxidoreductase n=1 Tax=Streptomyces sp. VNUA24 TaxID=3031131 RepID=UPI0023B82EAF|nr:SDR family oxidoreductase [Streptomyces sp. VNUA24]WEH12860.1 SDR family NAD(P)-dependent oxidoreductase [Streptomyces sp. VNUA24]
MTARSAPVYLVAGASSGIGAAVAHRAGAAGARVAVCGRRRDALVKVADGCGGTAHVADVTVRGDVEDLVAAVVREHGRLDGVVANAGVMRPGGVADLSDEDWDATLRTNLTSVFLLARAALPELTRSRGAFVTVGSIAGLRAPSGMAAYAASKAGAAMLTASIATEFGPLGVRANTVCPGWTRTEMADQEMREFGEPLGLGIDASYEAVTALVPQRRPALAEEIADAVLWLLGPGSSYVNGTTLTVDGGTTMVDPGAVPFDFTLTPRQNED